MFTGNTRENTPAPVCCQDVHKLARFIRSSERPGPHLWLVVASYRWDLLHSGLLGHTGIDLRDRMTSRERDTATGSRVKWNSLEGGAWPLLYRTEHCMLLVWCPQPTFHRELDQRGSLRGLSWRVPEHFLPSLTVVASSVTCCLFLCEVSGIGSVPPTLQWHGLCLLGSWLWFEVLLIHCPSGSRSSSP